MKQCLTIIEHIIKMKKLLLRMGKICTKRTNFFFGQNNSRHIWVVNLIWSYINWPNACPNDNNNNDVALFSKGN